MKERIQDSDKKFEHVHPKYSSMDSAPQTFFYTLTNLLNFENAKNILEVGCGAGKLLSTIVDLKSPQTYYYATDLSQGMVKNAYERLKSHFDKFQSKMNYDEWLKKQNFEFGVENGENISNSKVKFDRIISNMVLCHADDPEKMLKNWHTIAQNDCLLGLSLLGDPNKNHLVRGMRQAIEQAGQKLPEGRPPYYWYDKIQKIVQESGWQIILSWEQNSVFPFLSQDTPFLQHMISHKIPQKAKAKFNQMVQQMFTLNKLGVQSYCRAIIARKKPQKE